MLEEDFPPLNPLTFFGIEWDVPLLDEGKPPLRIREKEAGRCRLPATGGISGEPPFALVYMGWSQSGLAFRVVVEKPVERVSYPDVQACDSVELFIDTRDRKGAGFANRFCHHFFFLPEAYNDHVCGEITRFRTDDAHPLCAPEDLFCEAKVEGDRYALDIYLPKECLTGYDPAQFKRLGFTYRINTPRGPAQHFAALTEEYPVEQQPSLWARLHLNEEVS